MSQAVQEQAQIWCTNYPWTFRNEYVQSLDLWWHTGKVCSCDNLRVKHPWNITSTCAFLCPHHDPIRDLFLPQQVSYNFLCCCAQISHQSWITECVSCQSSWHYHSTVLWIWEFHHVISNPLRKPQRSDISKTDSNATSDWMHYTTNSWICLVETWHHFGPLHAYGICLWESSFKLAWQDNCSLLLECPLSW